MSIGIGETLRAARERQGRTVQEASQATRVRADYLEALENEQFEILGGDVYAKGFLRTYGQWLGVDPEPLLDLYRTEVQQEGYDPHALVEHPVASSPRTFAPTWLVWTGVAGAVLFLTLVVGGLFGSRTPEPAIEPQQRTEAPPAVVEPPVVVEPEPEPEPSPSPSPSPTGVNLVLLLEESSWMRVRIGGRSVFEGTVPAGETKEFQAPERVELRLGNAGGVRLVLNGMDLGSPGARGRVWEGTCTIETCSTGRS
ncbi:MAG: helix-turn-helix domain-containing protein [Actinomycetota bacterium]|nr:helix-turn-helix domain-containing protein [Actinomycetota bacterium]